MEILRPHDKTSSRPRGPVRESAGTGPSATPSRQGVRTGWRDPVIDPSPPSRAIAREQVRREDRHRFPGHPLHERSIRRRRGVQPRSDDTARPTSLGRHRSPNQSMSTSSNALLQPLTTTCTHIFTALIYHSTAVFWTPRQFCTPRTQTILIELARNELLPTRLTPLFHTRRLRGLTGRTSLK